MTNEENYDVVGSQEERQVSEGCLEDRARECIIYHRDSGEELFQGPFNVRDPLFRSYFPHEETYVLVEDEHGILRDEHSY